eukprot:g3922.t1
MLGNKRTTLLKKGGHNTPNLHSGSQNKRTAPLNKGGHNTPDLHSGSQSKRTAPLNKGGHNTPDLHSGSQNKRTAPLNKGGHNTPDLHSGSQDKRTLSSNQRYHTLSSNERYEKANERNEKYREAQMQEAEQKQRAQTDKISKAQAAKNVVSSMTTKEATNSLKSLQFEWERPDVGLESSTDAPTAKPMPSYPRVDLTRQSNVSTFKESDWKRPSVLTPVMRKCRLTREKGEWGAEWVSASGGAGELTCQACPFGHFSNDFTKRICAQCPPGSYNGQDASTECFAGGECERASAAEGNFDKYCVPPNPHGWYTVNSSANACARPHIAALDFWPRRENKRSYPCGTCVPRCMSCEKLTKDGSCPIATRHDAYAAGVDDKHAIEGDTTPWKCVFTVDSADKRDIPQHDQTIDCFHDKSCARRCVGAADIVDGRPSNFAQYGKRYAAAPVWSDGCAFCDPSQSTSLPSFMPGDTGMAQTNPPECPRQSLCTVNHTKFGHKDHCMGGQCIRGTSACTKPCMYCNGDYPPHGGCRLNKHHCKALVIERVSSCGCYPRRSQAGQPYRGRFAVTKSGRSCKPWASAGRVVRCDPLAGGCEEQYDEPSIAADPANPYLYSGTLGIENGVEGDHAYCRSAKRWDNTVRNVRNVPVSQMRGTLNTLKLCEGSCTDDDACAKGLRCAMPRDAGAFCHAVRNEEFKAGWKYCVPDLRPIDTASGRTAWTSASIAHGMRRPASGVPWCFVDSGQGKAPVAEECAMAECVDGDGCTNQGNQVTHKWFRTECVNGGGCTNQGDQLSSPSASKALLTECQGHCTGDDKCEEHLHCVGGSHNDAVIGCVGTQNLAYNVCAPKEPPSGLGVCEGACTDDDDCNGNLRCVNLQQVTDVQPLPCAGVPRDGYSYCIPASSAIVSDENKRNSMAVASNQWSGSAQAPPCSAKCVDELEEPSAAKPWDGFVSCAAAKAACDSNRMIKQGCAKTCGLCSAAATRYTKAEDERTCHVRSPEPRKAPPLPGLEMSAKPEWMTTDTPKTMKPLVRVDVPPTPNGARNGDDVPLPADAGAQIHSLSNPDDEDWTPLPLGDYWDGFAQYRLSTDGLCVVNGERTFVTTGIESWRDYASRVARLVVHPNGDVYYAGVGSGGGLGGDDGDALTRGLTQGAVSLSGMTFATAGMTAELPPINEWRVARSVSATAMTALLMSTPETNRTYSAGKG